IRNAATALGVRRTAGRVHLHRHADDVVSRSNQQPCSDGRIDAAAHRRNHALPLHDWNRITLGRRKPKPPMAGLGERFRAAREARGLSLSEVSEQIRIRSVYLAAIEEERWSA